MGFLGKAKIFLKNISNFPTRIKNGYLQYYNNGWRWVHRTIAQIKTGRKIQSGHEVHHINRQKLDKAYYRSNIIASRCSYFLKTKNQIGPKSVLIQIPQNRSFDINNSFDLEISKFIAKKLKLCQI